MTPEELNRELGNIDIYLLDQVLKGRYQRAHRILDVGCGEGRNLVYFIRNGYQVQGIDQDASAILMLQYVARSLRPDAEKGDFLVGKAEALPYADQSFDALISIAVLHFAHDKVHFWAMIAELHRVLKPGGTLFIRMNTAVGIEAQVEPLQNDLHALQDGSIRFLLTRMLLDELLQRFQMRLLEPFKAVVVADMRAMCTLMLEKSVE